MPISTFVPAVLLIVAAALAILVFWRLRRGPFLRPERAVAERVRYLTKHANDIILTLDRDWKILDANDRAAETYGYSLEELQGLTLRDLRSPETRAVFDRQIAAFQTHEGLALETTHQRKDGSTFPVEASVRTVDFGGSKIRQAVIRDVTDRKRAQEALRCIEWMLTTRPAAVPAANGTLPESSPPHGDLTALNRSRTILDAVGKDLLLNIVSDHLDLLGTSSVVLEKNGDYALAVFASGWCQFLNQASRRLCNTPDNQKALRDGLWHCHESCWTKCSRLAVQTGQPVDVPCAGGIRLYTAPIRAGTEIVGSISFGYGNPPSDPRRLQELANAFGVGAEALRRRAESYEARPPFIVELAKKRLLASARLIGEIVERNRAVQALQKLSARNEALLGAIPDILTEVDTNKVYTWLNQAGYDFFGADALGREAAYYFVGEQDTYNRVQPLLEGAANLVYVESWQRRQDGQKRLLAWWCRVLKDPHGNVAGALSTARDITEQKRAEEALRENEERLKFVLEGSQQGLWDWNLETGEVLRDKRWAEMLGYSLPEIEFTVQQWTDLLHPDDRAAAWASLHDHLEGRTSTHEVEHRMRAKDGQYRWILDRAKIVSRDSQGRPLRMSGTHTDVTERKRADEERRTLEAKVQQAQKLESLGVLAGGIAHDFNNLLMVVLGNADLALQDLSEVSPVRPTVEEIERAARQAADLCTQMLAYSGKGRFVVKPISLPQIIEEMGHMLEVSISKKAVLRYDFADNLPLIQADPTQIRQVVMNLIINASEAIGDKNGVISLATRVHLCDQRRLNAMQLGEDLPEGPYVSLEVADTGCGMDPETLQKIFDPFFTTKFTGRGLGLAAVLGIMRSHKGAIQVDSVPGKGTTFQILFPALEDVSQGAPPDGAKETPWRGHGVILLVDDEETIRSLGKRMLERIGFQVLLAADGREALDVFRKHAGRIACVLLDLTMPHMDGEATARKLRRIRKHLRIIMTSGYSEQEVAARFVGMGLAGFLQKPYQTAELTAILRRVLEG